MKSLNIEERIRLFRKLASKRNGFVEDNKFHLCIHFPYFTFRQYETIFTVYWDIPHEGPSLYGDGYPYPGYIAVEFKLKSYFNQAKYLSLMVSQQPSVFGKWVSRIFRFKSVELGNSSFDKMFYIHCRDYNLAKQLFDYDIQAKLLECVEKKPYLFIYKRKLTLSFWNIQEEENEYDMIIELAINLWGKMRSLGHC